MSLPKGKFTVHLLDKDPISAMILKGRLVQNAELEVRSFQSIHEGLVNFRSNPQLVVIQDELDSDRYENGWAVIKEMQCLNPNVRFILFSEHYSRETMFSLINDTSVSYLSRANGRFVDRVEDMILSVLGKQRRFVA